MKTFDQLLQENPDLYLNLAARKLIIETAKAWLTQERQEIRPVNLGGEVDKIFDDLLEELDK